MHITSTGAPPGDTRNGSPLPGQPGFGRPNMGGQDVLPELPQQGNPVECATWPPSFRLQTFTVFFWGHYPSSHLGSRVQGRRTGILLSVGSEHGGSALTTFGFLFLPEVCPGSHHVLAQGGSHPLAFMYPARAPPGAAAEELAPF